MNINAGNASFASGTQAALDPKTEALARELEKCWKDYQAVRQTAEALAHRPGLPPDLIQEVNRAASDILADTVMDVLKEHFFAEAKKPAAPPSGPEPGPARASESAGAKEAAGGGPETPKPKPSRQLSRVEYDKMLAGVCGGLAEYFRIDSSLVRVGFILTALPPFMFVGLIAYVILTILLPLKLTPDEG
ncbi:MAG TPA: PspC domain-containing protein [bacterium]|nr:PspC domain-containing protein [bacterium]HOL94630.1 PspC domain-containing protein [bacterium]HPP02381.1 PspC domain-containing protein [bacterium]HXK94488.1 PspC domain-containing protein [bacterium]